MYLKNGVAKFVAGKLDKSGAAYAVFNNTLFTNGWGVLDIKSGYGAKLKDSDIMYAAGFIEGILTARQIWDHYVNMRSFFLPNNTDLEGKIRKYFMKQDKWMTSMIKQFGTSDPFWRHVSYINAQLDGLYDGYKTVASSRWAKDKFVVQMLNAVGDLLDLRQSLDPSFRQDFTKMTPQQIQNYILKSGHCSALVKLTGGFEDLYMAHSSWFSYTATLRIYKHYNFNLHDKATAAKSLSFSSYPGFLESLDDFYTLSSKMVLLQTTNNIFNSSLYNLVTPESLLAWQRVRIASHMAKSGKEWAVLLGKHNSGTYNNQYMVIDLKKIQLGKSVKNDALWVVEQIPGLVVAGDQTPILRAGYWPSYNVPFYEEIYNKSGYPDFVAKHGINYSYQLAPRAKIFRRDQDNVVTFGDMKYIMRYNDYKNDKYSSNDPCNTICCRGDLRSDNPSPSGCYDSKVTTYAMALQRQAHAINGPTLGSNLTAFSWSGPFSKYSHQGLPKAYRFPWVYMSPTL